MYQLNNKGQTSIEFVIIIAIILLITILFMSTLYSTNDINTSIYTIKETTLQLITLYDSPIILKNINYSTIDKNIDIQINLQQINTNEEPLNTNNYTETIQQLKDATKFENINITLNYLH